MSGHSRVAGCCAMLAGLVLAAPAAWAEGSPSSKSDPAAQPSVILTIAPPPGGFLTPPVEGAPAPQSEARSPSPAPDGDSIQSSPAEMPGTETAPEIVQEPPPPPAHPVVAAIREKLADPALAKGDDYAALQAFYAERTEPPLWVTETGLSPKAQAAIKEIQDANQWGLDARAFDPPSAEAQLASVEEQADAEIKLGLAILKYARYARGGRLQPSRISKLFDQRPPVRAPKAVLAEIAAADAPDAYIRSLHPKHPQFQKLREALVNASGDERQVQLITANMERWRWLPAELGAFHIWNNVPEFNTRVVKGGQTIYVEKTIVGELKYATPFFSAPMRSVVFHPDWNVPETILREDLQPALQQRGFFGPNVAVLQKHGLRVSLKGQPVDPRTVDWNAVNIRDYTFTQPPGPANVLGKFKFNFPNRHAVYMHDTPQRDLFAKPVRTLSHGCIRVNDPERLAALLLAEDKGWSQQQVGSMLGGGNKVVPLGRQIPVHLTYFTVVVDESGRLQTFPDYYGLDNPTVQALFGSAAVRFQGPSVPAGEIVSQAPARQQQRRPGRMGGPGSVAGSISGLFGN
jgi:L,D-transpeptidase YcbB